ncbi:MAG: hypothetical protein K9N47_19075 [Prosthecobacter sp.]|uniref:hypothetical protein n=1 Tax=Prosthecobacter sp. TaxID=1965333 RepID=UPI0025DBA466|nr:hypothetical protein [Prosthecobacter sp.]MCF7788234.1 hypothetical protein [Prosthecobacter sp.]
MRRLLFLTIGGFLWLSSRTSLQAHAADQSEMRVLPKPHQLEIRLTFNILTLTRFTGIDTNGDAKISMAELTAAQPRIGTYLNQHIQVEINQQNAMLGSGVRFEPLWPDAAQTPPMSEPEYAARNVDVTFVQTIEGKVLEDFWLGFEIFEQTGPMQTIHAVFTQDGRNEDVSFSVQEPEYLYDTGYAEDPFVQEAEKQQKGGLSTPTEEENPMRPAAVLATASPYAAPAASSGGKPAATLASGPTGNPAVKLATPIESQAAPAAASNERWWMIRAALILVILVIGRKLQLSARNRLVSTRRRPRPR